MHDPRTFQRAPLLELLGYARKVEAASPPLGDARTVRPEASRRMFAAGRVGHARPILTVETNPAYLEALERRRRRAAARVVPEPGHGRLEGGSL